MAEHGRPRDEVARLDPKRRAGVFGAYRPRVKITARRRLIQPATARAPEKQQAARLVAAHLLDMTEIHVAVVGAEIASALGVAGIDHHLRLRATAEPGGIGTSRDTRLTNMSLPMLAGCDSTHTSAINRAGQIPGPASTEGRPGRE